MDREGLSRIRGSGKAQRAFPLPAQPREAGEAYGSGPLPSGAPSGHVGPRGMKKRGQWAGTLWDQRIEDWGNTPRVSPTHLGPGSLLGSWTWSFTLQSQGTPGPL